MLIKGVQSVKATQATDKVLKFKVINNKYYYQRSFKKSEAIFFNCQSNFLVTPHEIYMTNYTRRRDKVNGLFKT